MWARVVGVYGSSMRSRQGSILRHTIAASAYGAGDSSMRIRQGRREHLDRARGVRALATLLT